MVPLTITCLILVGICAVGGWLYMMYDCLRDVFKPDRLWQRHWKWRLAAGTVFICVLVGGSAVIGLITLLIQGAMQ